MKKKKINKIYSSFPRHHSIHNIECMKFFRLIFFECVKIMLNYSMKVITKIAFKPEKESKLKHIFYIKCNIKFLHNYFWTAQLPYWWEGFMFFFLRYCHARSEQCLCHIISLQLYLNFPLFGSFFLDSDVRFVCNIAYSCNFASS